MVIVMLIGIIVRITSIVTNMLVAYMYIRANKQIQEIGT